MLPFSGYAFNKSHTAGYGLVAYWTAYLKANYPAEYMAALLTSVGDDKDKAAVYLAECRTVGIKVLCPRTSTRSVAGLRRGRRRRAASASAAVRNVGENVVDLVDPLAQGQGPLRRPSPTSWTRSRLTVCNKRAIESLIKAGAFDSLDHTRRALIDGPRARGRLGHRRQEAGVDRAGRPVRQFEDEPGSTSRVGRLRVPDAEWARRRKLGFEREMLGLYVSDHPLDGTERLLARNRDTTIAELLEAAERTEGEVRVAGLITKVDRRINKNPATSGRS